MRSTVLLRTTLVMLIVSGALLHGQQASFPFQLLVTTQTTSNVVANGGSVTFLAAIGQTETAHMIFTYQGTGTAQFSQAPAVFGSPSFSVTVSNGVAPSPTLPVTLNPGDNIALDVVFKPSSALEVSGQLVLPFLETVPTTVGLQSAQNSITLNFIGTAPSFAFSYVLQSNLNSVPIQPGGTIAFPATLVNAAAQAAFVITNSGSGAGQITGVSLLPGSSPAFQLQATPGLPANLSAGQVLQATLLVYTPTAVGNNTGQLQITYGSVTGTGSTTATFSLTGSGSSSSFTYAVIQSNGQSTTVAPSGTITLPDTAVGSTSSVIVKVQNSGNAVGIVNSVNLTGQGFQLTGVPPTAPSLMPNASFTFSITFTPTQPGPFTGQLAVGADLFNLSGQGLGPQLGLSYVTSAGTTITINATTNPAVVFTPIQVTQSEQLTIMVTNTGTSQATVSNVSIGVPIGQTISPFSVPGEPALPVTLAPGASFSFNVAFAPILVGFAQGTLQVDANAIPLSGSGTTPPPLPSYSFQGASGTVSAQSQPGVGLTLAAPYPVALAGVLTLTTSGNMPTDPAVQFLTGFRTIPFLIPANSTTANFAGQGSQAFLQSGTIAETITLTPSFATQLGGVDITPASPATMQLTVPSAAPTLIAVQLASSTSNGFSLNIIGYSTTRTLSSLSLTFAPASGFNVAATQFTVNLSQVAPLWFQSTAALTFGGQFEINLPFTLQGTVASTQTLLQTIASVSVTATNSVGASNSVQTNLQ